MPIIRRKNKTNSLVNGMQPSNSARPLRVASNKHISIDNGPNQGFNALNKSSGGIKRKGSLKKAVSLM
jgi:hypothetical protein